MILLACEVCLERADAHRHSYRLLNYGLRFACVPLLLLYGLVRTPDVCPDDDSSICSQGQRDRPGGLVDGRYQADSKQMNLIAVFGCVGKDVPDHTLVQVEFFTKAFSCVAALVPAHDFGITNGVHRRLAFINQKLFS